MKKIAYLIKNVEEYGKLMAFLINRDVTVWRTYWDEKQYAGERVYQIDWFEKRCYYCDIKFYKAEGYTVVEPIFELDQYGNWQLKDGKEV